LENTGTTHIYSSTGLIYKQDFWVSPFSSVHFSSSLPVPLPTDGAPSPSLLSLPISLSLPTAPLPTVGAPLPHPSLSLSPHTRTRWMCSRGGARSGARRRRFNGCLRGPALFLSRSRPRAGARRRAAMHQRRGRVGPSWHRRWPIAAGPGGSGGCGTQRRHGVQDLAAATWDFLLRCAQGQVEARRRLVVPGSGLEEPGCA
jgi:hypothetical protein